MGTVLRNPHTKCYQLNYCMKQSPFGERDGRTAGQSAQIPTTCPCPEPVETGPHPQDPF